MTDTVIVYTDADGLKIISPVDGCGLTLQEIADKDVPEGLEYAFVKKDDVPADRTFRGAWQFSDTIKVDMNKARDIHMGRIRIKRDEKMKELDIQTMMGKDVQAQKQVLRDIPQKFDLKKAKTPEELKTMMPEELK